ncbi:hypothetical protein ABZ516_13585 [Streptomyces sp. NPDC019826]|uniref:hypothetical protein n=1 Tax=Streptomyces sp. NPDC019826 TaxID=3156667 RepID=UPI0033E81541
MGNFETVGTELDEIISNLDYSTTYIHECSHWVRYHGTTAGACLSLMKYAQQRTLLRLRNVSDREKFKIFRGQHRPLFSFDTEGTGSEEFRLTRQLWLDMQIGHKILLDSKVQDDVPWDRDDAMRSALTDSFIFSPLVHDPSSPVISPARSPETAVDWSDSVAFVQAKRHRVTTKSLFECAATIDQFLAMPWAFHSIAPEYLYKSLENLIAKFREPSYGIPAQVYAEIVPGFKGVTLRSHLCTLLAIIDFSLNPPLPPVVDSTELIRAARWRDIYPPMRFARACHAIGEIGPLDENVSEAELSDFLDALAEKLGVPSPSLYTSAFTRDDGSRHFLSGSMHSEDYMMFLGDVQRKLWNLRRSSPSSIVLYGAVSGGSRASVSQLELLLGDDSKWFHPPFHWTHDDHFKCDARVDVKISDQYIKSVATFLTLNHVAAVGPEPKGHAIPGVSPAGLWAAVSNSVNELLAFDVLP